MMLSSSVIKNVSQASHYYSEQDNYYTKEEGVLQSEWWGNGAKKLGLTGNIDAKQFTDLLSGKLATGELLGKMVDGEIKHRAGWDLTFSAPKSVSILALIGGDTRLIEAHRSAVMAALSHIEQGCAQARITTSDGMRYQNTKNLTVGLFHHDVSRAKDPQIHTHATVMNMTERLDGKIRSLASQAGKYNEEIQKEVNGFIERVRHFNRFYSKVYETELAFRVKELGYEIKTDTPSGIFEIEGVSDEAITHFSKRREQIKKQLEEKGLSGGKAAQIATLDNREKKEIISREVLKETWETNAKLIGLDCEKIINQTKDRENKIEHDKHVSDGVALKAIKEVAKELSVFRATFTLEELVIEASSTAIKHNIKVNSLVSAVQSYIKSGELISLLSPSGKTLLMTQTTLASENHLFSELQDHRLKNPALPEREMKYFSVKHNITIDQQDHLQKLFGQERVVILEGEKAREELLDPFIKIAKSANKQMMLLSPSLIGSKTFAHEFKRNPQSFWDHIKGLFSDQTLQHRSVLQFLSQIKDNKITKPDILLVENAQLLSTEQQAGLIEWNKINESKLILLGNQSTLLSQQVGVSLNQLKERGVLTISMNTTPNNIYLPIDNMLKERIAKAANRVVEVQAADDRYQAMGNHYSKLNVNDRKTSWLVVNSKQTANQLNEFTHEALKENGSLGKSINVNVLVPIFLTEDKGIKANTYQKGQVVRFNENYTSLKINRGEYLRVVRHSKVSNRVVLQHDNGKHVILHPDKVAGGSPGKIELFYEIKREMAINEMIIINRSIKAKEIVKGERFTITDVKPHSVTLKNDQHKNFTLDLTKPHFRHFDYGYAATAHNIAHEKPKTIIAELPAKSLQTDQRRFNQIVTQSKETWIYTDDQKEFLTQLEKRTGDKLSANDFLKQSEETKKSFHAFYEVLENKLKDKLEGKNQSSLPKAIDAVDYALKHLAEREAGFSHKDLMQVAMKHAMGDVSPTMLNNVVLEMEKLGISLRGDRNDGTLWTLSSAVKMEREILALSVQDKGKLQPIASDEVLANHKANNLLRPEQMTAITAITQSNDRVLSIQGRAGTGKTTMMIMLADVLQAKSVLDGQSYHLHCIAPTHKAVKELTTRGLIAQTVDSFLLDMRRLQSQSVAHDFSRTLLVVDEASMVSNRNMLNVLKVGHELNFRAIIPTGDTAQNPSIESGKPQALIQNQLDNTIYLQDIQRQKNPILKAGAEALYKEDINQTFLILKNHIIEISDKTNNDASDTKLKPKELNEKYYNKRVDMIVRDYLSQVEKGENVQIIAPSHADRKAINNKVRSQLHLADKNNQSYSILCSQDMTGVERSRVSNFKPGQIVRFSLTQNKHIRAGDYFTIKDMNKDHQLLILSNASGQEIPWQIPKNRDRLNNSVEVFKSESRELAMGDKIVWTRTDKKEGRLSTDTVEVVQVEKNLIAVKDKDGNILTFNAAEKKFQHWDHAYAITTYGSQGGTYSTVLALFESYREKLMNLKNLLVTITRPENELRVYTNSIETLKEKISENNGDKVSALEVIGEFPHKAAKKVARPSEAKMKLAEEPHFDRYTIQRIKEGLNQHAEKIATDCLGTPKERGGNYLKFGTKQGSLSVTTKGDKQGWFNDFESNQGGRDMLKFLQIHGQMDKKSALKYAAGLLGILPNTITIDRKVQSNKPSLDNAKSIEIFSDYEKRRIKLANKLAHASVPIKSTLAEKYLKEHRGVDLDKVPDDIRFHSSIYSSKNGKSLPALLAIARDQNGKVQAVEAIYLDPNTANKADVSLPKQTIGPKKGAVVMLKQTNKNAPTLIAEGVVTGLSLAKSLSETNVIVTLGKQMFASIEPKNISQKAIFCLDNDGKDLKIDSLIKNAASRLINYQKEVSFMVPNGLDIKKQDYNDILKHKGMEAVKVDFQRAISYENFYKSKDQTTPIQPEILSQLSREQKQQDKKNLSAYHSLHEVKPSISIDKSINRIIETIREI